MSTPPYLVGVNLKMYFSARRTLTWARAVAETVRRGEAASPGLVETFVLPSFVSIPACRRVLGDSTAVGGQDIAAADSGAFTGEVSGAELAEHGCRFALVGHWERRTLFADTDDVVRAKVAAAVRHGLTPIVCVGERERGGPDAAAATCSAQLARSFGPEGVLAEVRIVVAYEPVWAIGAAEPAPADHIAAVCSQLRGRLAEAGSPPSSRVVYGGSAEPGLLARIGRDVDGLFLGRRAHDPAGLAAVLDDVRMLSD